MRRMNLRRLSPLLFLTVLTLLLPAWVASPSVAGPPDPTLLRVEGGWLRGAVTGEVIRFSGVPYAAPPVGERRWTAPAAPEKWKGVRAATTSAPKCPQPGWDNDGDPVVIGDEDCLYLDVVRPRRPERRGPMPVLVWLHGGNLTSGAGSEYDGARLATRGDIVVVTVNYRLGALGFLSSPALDSSRHVSGNDGLLDQAAALRWVRRNIRAFGGDPRRITLAGQSAGARSVCAHLASPRSRRLFHRAIVQSGPCTQPVMNKTRADTKGRRAVAELGCTEVADAAACLRRVPVTELLELTDRGSPFLRERRDDLWGPVAGTPFLPLQPQRALRRGDAAGVPLLLGSMRDEARGAVLGNLPDLSAEEYSEMVGTLFGDDAEAVLAAYPAGDHRSPALALARVLTDWGYSCPTLATARVASRHAPVYAYAMHEASPPVGGTRYGAYHGWDLPFLWRTSIPFTQYPPLSPDQRRLSARMVRYWTTFVSTGAPDGRDRSPWRTFSASREGLRLAVSGTRPIRLGPGHHCGLWGP